MNHLLSVVFLLGAGAGACQSQGTLNFANIGSGVDAPAVFEHSGERVSGSNWQATLELVISPEIAVQASEPVPFQSGALAGYFLGSTVTLDQFTPLSAAALRVRVTDTDGEWLGLSDPTAVQLGGDLRPPANLTNLTEIAVKPMPRLQIQPSTTEMVVLSWHAAIDRANLEFTLDPVNGPWQPFTEAESRQTEDRFEVEMQPSLKTQYFRLRID